MHADTGTPAHLLVTGLRGSGTRELAGLLSERSGLGVAHLDKHPAWKEYQADLGDGLLAAGLIDDRRAQALWDSVYNTLGGLTGPTIVEGEQLLDFPELSRDYRIYLVNPPAGVLRRRRQGKGTGRGLRSRPLDPDEIGRHRVRAFTARASWPRQQEWLRGLVALTAPVFVGDLADALARTVLTFEAARSGFAQAVARGRHSALVLTP